MSQPPDELVAFWRTFLRSRLWVGMRALTALVVVGSCGYWLLGQVYLQGGVTPELQEAWTPLDCIYMTVISVTTIGYGETLPLPPGTELRDFPLVRLYTIGLVLVSALLVAYSVSSATAFFVEGVPQKFLNRWRLRKRISVMKGHYIVCGCGVTGRVIVEELLATGKEVVVVDGSEESLEIYQERAGVLTVVGDATEDEVLRQAGVERAQGLAAALPHDKDNLFLLVTARQLNPDLRIVSAATSQNVGPKLSRAGADGVVASSHIGGLRLASELVRPQVVSFLDQMLRAKGRAVRFAQAEVGRQWAGRTLSDLDIPGHTGLPVLAIQHPGEEGFVYNPRPDTPLQVGSVLVTMGEVDRVHKLEERIGGDCAAEFIGGALSQAIALEEGAIVRQESNDDEA